MRLLSPLAAATSVASVTSTGRWYTKFSSMPNRSAIRRLASRMTSLLMPPGISASHCAAILVSGVTAIGPSNAEPGTMVSSVRSTAGATVSPNSAVSQPAGASQVISELTVVVARMRTGTLCGGRSKPKRPSALVVVVASVIQLPASYSAASTVALASTPFMTRPTTGNSGVTVMVKDCVALSLPSETDTVTSAVHGELPPSPGVQVMAPLLASTLMPDGAVVRL